jgi:hypothetical protein
LIQLVEKKGKRVSSIALMICWTEISGPIQATKLNENNMLDYRFSIAPMMDWNESSNISIG